MIRTGSKAWTMSLGKPHPPRWKLARPGTPLGRAVGWLHYLAPDEPRLVTALAGPLKGRQIVLNLRYQWSLWLGFYEQSIRHALESLLRDGDTIYDVGAHVGYFSMVSAVRSPHGQVYAFEPNPANLRMLTGTVEANPDLNIEIIARAAGAARTEAEFVVYENGHDVSNPSLLGRLAKVAPAGDTHTRITVEVVDLDSFAAESKSWPDVVKIDVEGAEGFVLSGMTGILDKARPRLIIEVHHSEAHAQVTAILASHRYTVQALERDTEPGKPAGYPIHLAAVPVPEQRA